MSGKPNLVLFSPYLPAADTVGCARKIFDFIRIAARKGMRVNLIAFCDDNDRRRVDAVAPYCRSTRLIPVRNYFRFPRRAENVVKAIKDTVSRTGCDIFQCENSFLSRYIPDTIRAPRVLVEHDILSAAFSERASSTANPFSKAVLLARAAKKVREENAWYGMFGRVIVFTKEDKATLKRRGVNADIIPLGVCFNEYPEPGAERPHDLVFIGNFSHVPNVDAAVYFSKRILPLIKERVPSVSVVLAGAHPPRVVRKLHSRANNSTVTGYVSDIQALCRQSKILVAPVRFGGGMRYKVLEAFASGAAVVSTSIGIRGVEGDGVARIADDAAKFAFSAAELLSNQDVRQGLAKTALAAVKTRYDCGTIFEMYEAHYSLLLNQPAVKSHSCR